MKKYLVHLKRLLRAILNRKVRSVRFHNVTPDFPVYSTSGGQKCTRTEKLEFILSGDPLIDEATKTCISNLLMKLDGFEESMAKKARLEDTARYLQHLGGTYDISIMRFEVSTAIPDPEKSLLLLKNIITEPFNDANYDSAIIEKAGHLLILSGEPMVRNQLYILHGHTYVECVNFGRFVVFDIYADVMYE